MAREHVRKRPSLFQYYKKAYLGGKDPASANLKLFLNGLPNSYGFINQGRVDSSGYPRLS